MARKTNKEKFRYSMKFYEGCFVFEMTSQKKDQNLNRPSIITSVVETNLSRLNTDSS